MSVHTLSRRIAALSLLGLIAGCAPIGSGPAGRGATPAPATSTSRGDDCAWSRSRCIYEGRYEAGEREYAEDEAKRLNAAEYERLRRGLGR